MCRFQGQRDPAARPLPARRRPHALPERGYAALRFTEPAEDFNHQHQNIRTENGVLIGDLPQYNDYNYIARWRA
jgi:hypothetical protein